MRLRSAVRCPTNALRRPVSSRSRRVASSVAPTSGRNSQRSNCASTHLDQGRTHKPVNEITAITAATGTNWADPAHDRASNMTTIPSPANLPDGRTAIYDAWNRLVEVKDGQTVIARYE